ncbi:MAG: hypothetical protein AB1414_19370, partial [bacterium]
MDGITGPASPIVVISYNTHKDYDGKNTAGSGKPISEFGVLWNGGKGDSTHDGAVDKAVSLLDKMNVLLDSSRIVSHSTGHYLAMKIMNQKKVAEYWALSPNTRGSTMIHALKYLMQNYDSWEDMRRHNYDTTIATETKENICIEEIANLTLTPGSPTKSNILLSHGDAMTGGQGNFVDLTGNMGVLSYSDLQKVNYALGDKRRDFLKYEALDNLKNLDLKNLGDYKITIWDERKTVWQLLSDMGLLDAVLEKIGKAAGMGVVLVLLPEDAAAAAVVVYKAYETIGLIDTAKDIVLAVVEAGKYLAMDVMEHVDLDQRLKILGENYEYMNPYKDKIGAVNPPYEVKTEYEIAATRRQFLFFKGQERGTKISWTKGAGNLNGNTERYEIVRKVKGDNNRWKVGEVEFSPEMNDSTTFEYFDPLEGKIKRVEKVSNNAFVIELDEDLPKGYIQIPEEFLSLPKFRAPFRYTDGILDGKQLVLTDGDAVNHVYKILDNKSDIINLSDSYNTKGMEILCQLYDSVNVDDEIARIKKGNKFIIRGIEYEYSVSAWGVASKEPYRDRGVFLSVSLDSSRVNMDRVSPIQIRDKKIKTPWWKLFFGAVNDGIPIGRAKYRAASIALDTTYNWGQWIDLIPKDGIYDELEEEFETTISTANLTEGPCAVEIAVFDALEYSGFDTVYFLYDTTPPSIAENFSPRGGTFSEPPVITFNAEDALSGMKEARVIITKGGITYESGKALFIDSTYTYTSHVIESGGYTYRIEAEDNAGN